MALTPKQRLFVAEYTANGLNATKAAISAGYSARTAESQGSRLLTNVEVAAAIAAKTEKRLGKLEITAESVLEEISRLAFANMLDYIAVGENGSAKVDLSKLTREQAAAISAIEVEEFTERTGEDGGGKPTFENVKRVKFKLHDKLGGLRDLGRHLKLFTDKVEVEGTVAVTDARDELRERLAKLAAARSAGG